MYLLIVTLDGDVWARYVFNSSPQAQDARKELNAAHVAARQNYGAVVPRLQMQLVALDAFSFDRSIDGFARELREMAEG